MFRNIDIFHLSLRQGIYLRQQQITKDEKKCENKRPLQFGKFPT